MPIWILIFSETNNVTVQISHQRQFILTYLPYGFWFHALSFLSIFDIVNFYVSSERFRVFIFTSHYINVFKSMSNVCDKELWNRLLNSNFSMFMNKTKEKLEDDLEFLFIYLKLEFTLF